MAIHKRVINSVGVQLNSRQYYCLGMAHRWGQSVDIDDLDVPNPEEVAVRFEDGAMAFAQRVDAVKTYPCRKGPFERALRQRAPFSA